MIRDVLQINKEKIIEWINQGKSTCWIGEQFNCNPGTIWYFLKENNLCTINKKRTEYYGNMDNYKEQIVSLFLSGKSAYKISKEINIPKPTILRNLNKWGYDTSKLAKLDKSKPTLKSKTLQVIEMYNSGKSQGKIAKELGYSNGQVSILLNKNNVEIRPANIYTVNEEYFKVIDTEEKAYILGWWWSDGNVMKDRIRISVAEKDKKIIEWIKDRLEYTGVIYTKIREKPREHQVELCINRPGMANDLINLGCVINKSLILQYPKWIDSNLERHFIRGVFDGDGSIGLIRRKHPNISITGSYYFIYELINHLPCNYSNIYQRYKERDKEKSAHSLFIGRKEDTIKFLHWIYDDAKIWLDRKYDKAKRFLN